MLFIFREAGGYVDGWRSWAPVLSAVATSAAVLVALFGEPLRRYWARPRLRLLSFDLDEADGVEFKHPSNDLEQAYVRLRVENFGRVAARLVEVTIERVQMLDGIDRDRERDEQFKRQEHNGSVGNRLQWADRRSATLDIPAGTSRRIDLIYLSTDEPSYLTPSLDLALPMRLMLEKRSKGMERHILPQLDYRIWVTIAGSNVKPVTSRIDLQFGGVWLKGSAIWDPDLGGVAIGDPESIGVRRRRQAQKRRAANAALR